MKRLLLRWRIRREYIRIVNQHLTATERLIYTILDEQPFGEKSMPEVIDECERRYIAAQA